MISRGDSIATPGLETRPHRGPSAAGYVIVLVGVVGWVIGYFLPYTHGEPFGEIWPGPAPGVLGGAAIVGAIALWGIARPSAWTPYALVASSAAWALPWIINLISQERIDQITFFQNRETIHSVGLEVGWWVLLTSLVVVVIGTMVVLVSARAHADQ